MRFATPSVMGASVALSFGTEARCTMFAVVLDFSYMKGRKLSGSEINCVLGLKDAGSEEKKVGASTAERKLR